MANYLRSLSNPLTGHAIFSPDFLRYCNHLRSSPRLIWDLAKQDLRKSYIQSTFGIVWVFLDPIVMLGLLLFVFTVGVRGSSGPLTEFIPYVFSGLVSYYFFTDALRQSSTCISHYGFLVKKVNFKIEVLPLVRIVSCLLIHFVFIFLLILILLCMGVTPSFYWGQLFYYLSLQVIFLFALGTILSSIEPFFKDLTKIIPIVTRLMFWCTPIFWHAERVPDKYKIFLDINPLYFFVQGYRNSLIYSKPIASDLPMELIYIGVTGLLFYLGYKIQTALRPYFAEYL